MISLLSRFISSLAVVAMVLLAGIFAVSWHIHDTVEPYIIDAGNERAHEPIAIVPGSQIIRNKRPSGILKARLDGAVDLYKQGKVERLFLTGDGRSPDYNEVAAMKAYVVSAGVSEDDLLLDEKGLSTRESCRNAYQQYGIRSALVVTQPVFVDRAVYLCRSAGMDALGVRVGGTGSWIPTINTVRELAARVQAFLYVQVTK